MNEIRLSPPSGKSTAKLDMGITYLFDPLCGWCYGACPVLDRLALLGDATLELMPTGLFAGEGARYGCTICGLCLAERPADRAPDGPAVLRTLPHRSSAQDWRHVRLGAGDPRRDRGARH